MVIFNVFHCSLIVFLHKTRSIQHDESMITDRDLLIQRSEVCRKSMTRLTSDSGVDVQPIR